MDKKNKRWLWLGLSFTLLLILTLTANVTPVQAQDDCYQCHGDKRDKIEHSAHYFLSCTSCHTDIKGFPHPEGSSLDKKETVATCSTCHKGVITESYSESFHGKAVHLGSQKSATCTDCHGSHDILGPGKPASKVSKENIPKTCASCHGLSSPGFSQGSEHFQLLSSGLGAPMYYTGKFFTWLTIIVITALVIHIELQLYYNLRTILRERKRR